MPTANSQPEKESFVLVQFFHGDQLASQELYTDWDQSFLGYTSEPRMELEIPENEGTFSKRELRIILPGDTFTNRVSGGVPHSPIFIVVREQTQGLATGDQSDELVLYRGRVMRTIQNFQGRGDRIAFLCLPQKSRLDVTMGISCNVYCHHTLFKGGCGINQGLHQVFSEIDSKDGTEITVTDAAISSPPDFRFWKRGYCVKDGLRIDIRDYDSNVDGTKLQMAAQVPDDWIGGTNDILFVPGCDKSIETCRFRYDAEEFFEGLGFALPSHQPNLETE